MAPPGGLKHVASNEVGEVRWFDGNCGRISFKKFGEVFVHHSQVKKATFRGHKKYLAKGETVRCDLKRGPKGLQATSVVVVSSDDDDTSTHSSTSDDSAAAAARTFLEHDIRGEVASFTSSRGFGFIKTQQYGSIFFHVSDLAFAEAEVRVGQFVKCDVARGNRGLMAVGVQMLMETLAPRSRPHSRSPSAHSSPVRREVLYRDVLGEVERFNSEKQFGFIKAHAHGSVLVRRRDVERQAMLRAQQIVRFDIAQGPTTAMATNVKVVTEPTPPQCCPCAEPVDSRPTGAVFQLRRMFEDMDTADTTTKSKGAKRELCGICEDVLEDPVVTPCQHVFCRTCLLEWIPFQPTCPKDNSPLSKEDVKANYGPKSRDQRMKRFGRSG